jgi:hypothetical protein
MKGENESSLVTWSSIPACKQRSRSPITGRKGEMSKSPVEDKKNTHWHAQ